MGEGLAWKFWPVKLEFALPHRDSERTLMLTWLALRGRSYQLHFTTILRQPDWSDPAARSPRPIPSRPPPTPSARTASAFIVWFCCHECSGSSWLWLMEETEERPMRKSPFKIVAG